MNRFLTVLWVIILVLIAVSGVLILRRGAITQIEYLASWVINLIFTIYILASGR